MTDFKTKRQLEFWAQGSDFNALSPHLHPLSQILHRSVHEVAQCLLNLLKTTEPYRASKQVSCVSATNQYVAICHSCCATIEPNEGFVFKSLLEDEARICCRNCLPKDFYVPCRPAPEPLDADDWPATPQAQLKWLGPKRYVCRCGSIVDILDDHPIDYENEMCNDCRLASEKQASRVIERAICQTCGEPIGPNGGYIMKSLLDEGIQIHHSHCVPNKHGFCELCGDPVPDDGFQHKAIRCAACCKPREVKA